MRRFPAPLAVLVVLTLVPTVLLAHHHSPDRLRLTAERPNDPVKVRSRDSDPRTWQTSDRVIGPTLPSATTTRDGRVVPRLTTPARIRARYHVRPGVVVTSWQRMVNGRKLRYYVTRVAWRTPGIGFSLAQPRHFNQVQTVSTLVSHTRHSVAGVNGDFFDIGQTGAPLGLGVRAGRIEHGINWGWNHAFWVGQDGRPRIGIQLMTMTSPQYPQLGLTNLDSPQVRPGGIGVYDAHWGSTSGYAWTDGQKNDVLMAHVVGGVVKEFRNVYPPGTPIVGRYLVARDKTAVARLRTLKVGSGFITHTTIPAAATTAVTGNAFLLQDGKIAATDNREMHPRTGVGIDYTHKRLYFIVVEGRQEFSDGATMYELAHMFRGYGCSEALNLDGGGSSTLVARRAGKLQVLNSPSDGRQRKVADGIAITYVKPRRHK